MKKKIGIFLSIFIVGCTQQTHSIFSPMLKDMPYTYHTSSKNIPIEVLDSLSIANININDTKDNISPIEEYRKKTYYLRFLLKNDSAGIINLGKYIIIYHNEAGTFHIHKCYAEYTVEDTVNLKKLIYKGGVSTQIKETGGSCIHFEN